MNLYCTAKIGIYYSEMGFCIPLTSTKINVYVAEKESRMNKFIFNEKWYNGYIRAKTKTSVGEL